MQISEALKAAVEQFTWASAIPIYDSVSDRQFQQESLDKALDAMEAALPSPQHDDESPLVSAIRRLIVAAALTQSDERWEAETPMGDAASDVGDAFEEFEALNTSAGPAP